MATLKIYGYSDDLIETSGIPGCDEFSRNDHHSFGPWAGKMLVKAGGESLGIHAIYDGSWAFAINAEMGDYDILPEWTITRTFGKDRRYSETLEITDLPDDATLEWLDL